MLVRQLLLLQLPGEAWMNVRSKVLVVLTLDAS
jgi:hypothetical protein